MKKLIFLIIGLISLSLADAQTDKETLRKAIGYYQQLKFEKSIELFDEMVEANPDDISLAGRRGFVIAEFVKAIDDGSVSKIDENLLQDLMAKGIQDLKKSLDLYPNNSDNKSSLVYLKGRT